jgi:hypothetical protein
VNDRFVCMVTRAIPILGSGMSSLDRRVERKVVIPFAPFPGLVLEWETPAELRDDDVPEREWVDVSCVSFSVATGKIELVTEPDESLREIFRGGRDDDERKEAALGQMEELILPAYEKLGWEIVPVGDSYDVIRARYVDGDRTI